MKVQFALVGHSQRPPNLVMDLPAVPSVGDVIQWPRISQANTVVRTVVWYLTHDDEDSFLDEPFAYVVVGPQRRQDHGKLPMHERPTVEMGGSDV